MRPHDSSGDFLREHLREVPPFRALLRSVECEILVREGGAFLREPTLDLGSGDGHFASMAFERPPFAGMDPEFSSLLESRHRKSHRYLIAASGSSMPWPDESFATVVANSVLEHIPEVDATLEEISRVLTVGGNLILTVPSDRFAEMLLGSTMLRKANQKKMANRYGRWFNRHSRHFHTDSPEVWGRRLSEHGFEIKICEYYFTPMAHRIFDLAHYLSLPYLATRKLTGKWVLYPNSWRRRVWYYFLKRYFDSSFHAQGAYLFIVARKLGPPEPSPCEKNL